MSGLRSMSPPSAAMPNCTPTRASPCSVHHRGGRGREVGNGMSRSPHSAAGPQLDTSSHQARSGLRVADSSRYCDGRNRLSLLVLRNHSLNLLSRDRRLLGAARPDRLPHRDQQPLHLARAEAVSAADDRERLPCSIRRNELVPDRWRDSVRILAGEFQARDEVVECRSMNTELRGEVGDRLTSFVALNERHLLVGSQLPSLPRHRSPRVRASAWPRGRQLTEVRSPA